MTILIFIGVVILSLAIIFFIAALFAPKGYAIERGIIINRPGADVSNYLKYLKNQDNFSKWVMMDPDMKKDFRGIDGTVGFVYAWNGNKKAGAGEQEIKNIEEGKRMDSEIRFLRPFAAVANNSFITESPAVDQTKIRWTINSQMKYPMNAMLLFMNMDKLLGKDMETSLGTLKNIMEGH